MFDSNNITLKKKEQNAKKEVRMEKIANILNC